MNARAISQAERLDALLAGIRVMPVVVMEDASDALALADALLEGGVRAVEVTLRTDAALPAVETMARQRPDLVVGTGTVLNANDLRRSQDVGARFAVSPGLTRGLAEAALGTADHCPLLPGTATAGEVMAALDHGFTRLKFFPAETSGGAPAVRALGGPLPQARFCPTGGISPENADHYLSLPNVFCVGGSWITKAAAARDWAAVTAAAKASAA